MKFIIIGRAGTGKSTLANELAKRGLNVLRTSTTRPRRSDSDNYNFLTKEQADAIPAEEKLLATHIGEFEYFTTEADVEAADVLILEPNGAQELINRMPDVCFHIIHIRAVDIACIPKFIISRADDPNAELVAYQERAIAEDSRFNQFEKLLQDEAPIAPNCTVVHTFYNDYTQESLNDTVELILRTHTLLKNMQRVVLDAIDADILRTNDPEQKRTVILVCQKTGDEYPKEYDISIENMANIVAFDSEGFYAVVQAWLSCADI